MKLALFALLALSAPAFASDTFEARLDSTFTESAETAKSTGCSLLPPGQRDAIGRYCATGYGVLWNGYVLNNTCYFDINAAYNMMRSARVCYEPTTSGGCQILQPSQRDHAQRYCNNTYGVSYYGFVVDGTCYQSADSALSKMHSTRSCLSYPAQGRCALLQHGQRDRNGRYCDNAYGVAYDGAIVNNTCYYSLDTAMNLMQTAQYCRW